MKDELKGVVDITDPDNKSASQRRFERVTCEVGAFDEDHYLADYFEVDTAQQCIEFIPEFYSITLDEGRVIYVFSFIYIVGYGMLGALRTDIALSLLNLN